MNFLWIFSVRSADAEFENENPTSSESNTIGVPLVLNEEYLKEHRKRKAENDNPEETTKEAKKMRRLENILTDKSNIENNAKEAEEKFNAKKSSIEKKLESISEKNIKLNEDDETEINKIKDCIRLCSQSEQIKDLKERNFYSLIILKYQKYKQTLKGYEDYLDTLLNSENKTEG